MRAWVLGLCVLTACEGRVGEPGEGEPTGVVIRDRSGPQLVQVTCDTTTVVTRAPVTCRVEAKHPTGEPTRCRIDSPAGLPTIELGDCTTEARTAVIHFSAPGPVNLVITALDQHDRLASRTLAIEVTGLPNQPPNVTSLQASRMSGVAPLQTTLSWTSADPEGDAVTCAVDVGADGSIEFPSVDCATASRVLELRTPGSIPVKLIVTDSGGLTSERTVTLTVSPPTADLRIEKVEFGQSVMKDDLELVEDKPALFRVTVLANEPSLSAVVEVEAKQGATVLGTRRLEGPSVIPQVATPGDLSKSFRLMLPREWVAPGLTLSLKIDSNDAVLEADEANNARVVSPAVGQGNVLHLTAVPVVNAGLTGAPLDLEGAVTSIWPVKHVEAKTRAPYTYTGTLSALDTAGWAQLLGELAQVKGADGSGRSYFGFLKANFGGGVAGIGYVGQAVATGRDDSTTVAAHELGHNFGLNHAPCGGASGADPSYPYAGGKIGSYGFNGTQLLPPTQFVDVMSYCNPTWVSDHNYRRAQQHMDGSQAFDPAAVLPSIVLQDAALISGRSTRSGVSLGPVYRLRAAVTELASGGESLVRLTRVDGTELEVPVAWVETSEGDERHFFAIVPWPGELRRVALVTRGEEMTSRSATAAALAGDVKLIRIDARTIRVRAPAGVSIAVAHLGAERTTLTLGARGPDVLVRTEGLEGGVYEVSLSDGVRSARVELSPAAE